MSEAVIGPARREAGFRLVALLLVLGAGAVPLFMNAVAPMQDWPSHLARISIEHAMLAGPSPWSARYEMHGLLLPNAAIDAVVLALMGAGFGLEGAGRLCLLLCYALFVSGMLGLARAVRSGSGLAPSFAVLGFYNAAFFIGLVNYQFGIALAFWAVALWLRHGMAVRLAVAGPGMLLILLCHPIAALLCAGMLGCLDIAAIVTARRIRPGHCLSLVALGTVLALLLVFPGGGDGAASWVGGSLTGMAYWKASIFAKSLLGGSAASDGALLAGVMGLGVVVLAGWRIVLPGAVLFVLAMLVAVAVVAPQRVAGGSLLDFRIAVVPVLLGLACVRFVPRRPGRWWCAPQLLAAVAVAATLGRMNALSHAWREDEAAYDTLRAALAALPPGGVVLSGQGTPLGALSWGRYWSPPVLNIASLGVGQGLFVPNVFAIPLQQPLVLKPAYRTWLNSRPVETPAQWAALAAEAAPLCAAFPAGVHVLVIYPPEPDLPGVRRLNAAMGLGRLCG